LAQVIFFSKASPLAALASLVCIMASLPQDAAEEAVEKKGRRRKRLNKKRRDQVKKGRAAAEGNEEPAAETDSLELPGKQKKRKEQEDGGHDKNLDNRIWVGRGLPSDTDEQSLLEHFGACGAIRNIQLIRNSRLIFSGSCFISFKKDRSLQAALKLDGTDLNGVKISVNKAATPIKPPDLKVYVGGLPWKATEEVLRKDFGECGEISKFQFLKDFETKKFKGAVFIAYKTKAGVDAALKYHGTDYGGRMLTVRLASAKPEDGSEARRAHKPASQGQSEREEVVMETPEAVTETLEAVKGTPEQASSKAPSSKKRKAAKEMREDEEDPLIPFIERRARARKEVKVQDAEG